MKTTKKQALAIYDEFHGALRCHNGGTREENLRMAPHCYSRLVEIAKEATMLAANPSKRLLQDHWLMEKLAETIPDRTESFKNRYNLEI